MEKFCRKPKTGANEQIINFRILNATWYNQQIRSYNFYPLRSNTVQKQFFLESNHGNINWLILKHLILKHKRFKISSCVWSFLFIFFFLNYVFSCYTPLSNPFFCISVNADIEPVASNWPFLTQLKHQCSFAKLEMLAYLKNPSVV